MLKKMRSNEKGFTLVELVVVIAILAVLVTLLVPRILGNVQDAKKNTEIANARTLASEINVYNAKQETAATMITDVDADGTFEDTEVTGKLPLPAGIDWPSGTYATVKIDTTGNAYVNIIP